LYGIYGIGFHGVFASLTVRLIKGLNYYFRLLGKVFNLCAWFYCC